MEGTDMKKGGKLYVVGIGPGSYEQMTIKAVEVLKESQIIVGYTVYVDLVKDYFPGKKMITTPMRKETERCRIALSEASKGHTVSMICSGDSGVYGMSGLILELSGDYPEVEVCVIPGVTAACGGAAILGAPICHDFVVISLSDLLTPMEVIEERLRCAAKGDFVICLYNPSSKKRAGYLQRACDILLEDRSLKTVCGIVRNIGREGEAMEIMSLEALRDTSVDMFTTVYIGNSQTKDKRGQMITPRGYRDV